MQSVIDAINSSSIEPRDYQKRVVTKVIDSFNSNHKSVMLNSPTGSGKTIMGLLAGKAMQQTHDMGIAWVTMRRNLLLQAEEENTSKIGIRGIRFVSMFDKNPPTVDNDGRKIGMLIVDEAAHDSTSSMIMIHGAIKPKHVLGLSATPYRTDNVKLCFSKVIRDIGIHQLIKQGYLSPYHLNTIGEWSVEKVVDTYLREPEKWGQSVMFWLREADAIACRDLLRANGVTAETVTAKTDRYAQIDAFKRGDVKVLTNMVILTEGFNYPGLQTVFVRDSSKGPTIQMAGRVFRKDPSIEFKQIVQSENTKWPMDRTATPAAAFVLKNGRWLSLTPSDKLKDVNEKFAATLVNANSDFPYVLVTNKSRKMAWR